MKQINSLKAQNASFESSLKQAEEEKIVMQAQVVAWQVRIAPMIECLFCCCSATEQLWWRRLNLTPLTTRAAVILNIPG